MDKISAIYTRQSVDKLDSISVESQVEFCMYELRGDTNYQVYSDKGYSGKNINRPNFQRLLKDIKNGKISRVIVYKLDRISRSVLDFANMMDIFQKYNVEFISCNEKFDTGTPMGRAMLNICIVFAQLERETIQQRVKDTYASRSQKGFYMGGRIAYGFRLKDTVINNVHTKMYEQIEEEANQIKLMFELYSNPHTTVGEILKYFNEHGIKMTNGNPWSRARTSDHLKNPIYVKADKSIYDFYKSRGVDIVNSESDFIGENGCYLYSNNVKGSKYTKLAGRTLVLAPHKGIVEPDIWLKCRIKSLENEQLTTSRKVKNTWLAGLVKCGRCGYALTFKKYKNRNARYLLCSRKMNDKACAGAGTIYADEFEKMIFDKMKDKIKELKELEQEENNNTNEYNIKLRTLISEQDSIEKEIGLLVEKLTKADISLTKYINQKVSQLDLRMSQIKDEIEAAENEKNKQTRIDVLKVSDCISRWEELSLEDKQEIAWALIKRIDATSENVKIWWRF